MEHANLLRVFHKTAEFSLDKNGYTYKYIIYMEEFINLRRGTGEFEGETGRSGN